MGGVTGAPGHDEPALGLVAEGDGGAVIPIQSYPDERANPRAKIKEETFESGGGSVRGEKGPHGGWRSSYRRGGTTAWSRGRLTPFSEASAVPFLLSGDS